MSVRAFSQALSIPYTTYSNYEAGGEPKLDTLIKIADYLNVSIDTLLGYTPNEYEYYKQWLLSTDKIFIDDRHDYINISFFYNELRIADMPYDEIAGYGYSFNLGSKENLITVAKFIEKTITQATEADTKDRIISLFKYLNDIALKPSDVKANLNNNKQMTEIMDIVKYIHPINPLSEHNEISGFSGNLNNLTIHFDTDK